MFNPNKAPGSQPPRSSSEPSQKSERREDIEHREKAIDLVERMLNSELFQERVTRMNEQKLMDRLDVIHKDAYKRQRTILAEKSIREEAHVLAMANEQQARQGLSPFTTMTEAKRRLGKNIVTLFKLVREDLEQENPTLHIAGKDVPYNDAEDLTKQMVLAPYEEEMEEINRGISDIKMDTARELDDMNVFINLYRGDQKFLKALDRWGMSPSHEKEFDPNSGKIVGYHAGIVHFFEYRQFYEKSGRFYTREGRYRKKRELSLDSFAEFTEELHDLIRNPDPANNPAVEKSCLIADDEGRQRLILVTKTKRFLVAFRNLDEPMRIITMFPGDVGTFDRAVEEELRPAKNKPRYNNLNPNRKQIPYEQIAL